MILRRPIFQSYEEALVRACYNIILERELEPAAQAAQTAPRLPAEQEERLREIVRRFIESDEFVARRTSVSSEALLPTLALIGDDREEVLAQIRSRCRTTYLGNNVALCRILGRFHMFVHTSDVGFATHALHGGAWEMALTEFMVRTVKPGMRVLDVGGNFGYYSVLMADLVQHTGYCHVFEPNRDIARLLKRTLSVNGFDSRSHVSEVALSDRDSDSALFYIPHAEPKNARLVAEVDNDLAADGHFTHVPLCSLDGMASQIGSIDFIKIDAEGAEMDILSGMRGVIHKQRPAMVVEVNCGRDYDPSSMLRELQQIYGGMNYVGDDGFSHPVSLEELLSTNVGQDWMLHFE